MENSAGDCRAVPPPPRGSANNQQPTKDPCDQYRRQRPHTSVPAPHNHLHIHTNVRTTTRIVVSLFRRRSLDHGCLSGDVETLFDTMDRATFVSVKISRIDRFNVTSYTTDSSIYGVDPNASRRLGPRSSVMNGTHYHLLPTTAGLRTPAAAAAAATSTTYDGRPGACRQPNLTLTALLPLQAFPRAPAPPNPQHEACSARRPPGTAVERGEMLLGRERPRAVSVAPAGVAPCRCPLVRHSTRAYWRSASPASAGEPGASVTIV